MPGLSFLLMNTTNIFENSFKFSQNDIAIANQVYITTAIIVASMVTGGAFGFTAAWTGGGIMGAAVAGGVSGALAGMMVGTGALAGIGGYYKGPEVSGYTTDAFGFLDGCIGGAVVTASGVAAAAAGFALIPMTGGGIILALNVVWGWWTVGAVSGGGLMGAGIKGASTCL